MCHCDTTGPLLTAVLHEQRCAHLEPNVVNKARWPLLERFLI
jgi:hypothetical protein